MTRDELERKLARRFGRSLAEQEQRVLEMLDEPDGLARLTAEAHWEEERNRFPWLTTLLAAGALSAGLELVRRSPADTNLAGGKVVEATERWAREYSFGLIRDLNDTSRQVLTEALDKFFAEAMTRKELEEAVAVAFGPDRASRIAITEATRAYSAGALEAGREMAALGFVPRYVYHTVWDGFVCEDCEPWNGKVVEEKDFPPRHPNCRCGVEAEWDLSKTARVIKAVVVRSGPLNGEVDKSSAEPEHIYSTDETDWGVKLTDLEAVNLRLDRLQREVEKLKSAVVLP